MNIMITGAGGPIGDALIKRIIESSLGTSVQLIVAVADTDIIPTFTNSSNKLWIEKNLSEADAEWWKTIVDINSIDRIFYLECLETYNEYNPSLELTSRLKDSDNSFLDWLSSELDAPEILYMSTDRIYQDDKFPNELNNFTMSIGDLTVPNISNTKRYVTLKLSSEIELLSLPIILRVIRPFSIVYKGQDTTWPLSKLVHDAVTDNNLDILDNGDRGLVFTHVDDLVKLLDNSNLFLDKDTSGLTSSIINFCKTTNYLPEQLLVEKVKSKTGSSSLINYFTAQDNYPEVMRTPQVRNMSKIDTPRIPIEFIIEELYQEINPENTLAPLVITSSGYNSTLNIVISGTSEPLAVVSIFLGDGTTLTTDSNDQGSWTVSTLDPLIYEDILECVAYATTPEGIQYDTVVFNIDPA